MLYDALGESLRGWMEGLRRLNRRGLLLLCSSSDYAAALLSSLDGIRVLVVASSSKRKAWSDAGLRAVSPARVQKLLGSEYDAVVVDVEPPLLPNLLAAVAEMVKAPGFLGVVASCGWSWEPGGWLGTGGYERYLRLSLEHLSSLLVLDACGGRVEKVVLPESRGEQPWPPGPPSRVDREYLLVPRVLRSLVATPDQSEALLAFQRFAKGGFRSLLLVGDRGRGKSAALGLGLALLILRKDVGMVTVTAPSPESVQSLFRMLLEALRASGVRHRIVEREGVVVGVRGAWFHIRYHTPGELYEPGGLLVVDEAAAIGPHRLRMLSRKTRRVVAATTIHGYEGSGRTLLHMVESILPQPMLRVTLSTPIRYPPGDPLEEWLYETFVLRREATPVEPEPPVRCISYDGWLLAGDPWRARLVYEILAEAHYRNEPDDLALMLDAPHYRVYTLEDSRGLPLAVAEVSLEWLLPREKRMLWSLLGSPEDVATARIVRIAVRPGLQRRGLGSMLLRCVEQKLSGRSGVVVGAVYSRQDVTPFWLRNGYRLVYISPRFNRATGEKNIAVAKPLTAPFNVVAEAERRMRLRLLLAGQSVYRDLPAELVARLLSIEPLLSTRAPLLLEDWQVEELTAFVRGRLDHEAAWASVWQALVSYLSSHGLNLDEEHGVALAARLVQGKPLNEVAAILGVERREAARLVDEAARLLVSRALRESA